MNIPSPFEGLDIEKELVCEFFATLSRLEFALKELGYSRNERGVVSPAWWRFSEEIAKNVHIDIGSELDGAINFLCNEPPMVQISAQEWQPRDLHGEREIEKAIDAACRVRHNLFHGGKHTPHSPPGRDRRLVESAQMVLLACIEACPRLREVYVQNRF
ncbi:hypothetical protein ACK8HJ_22680 [Vreelandella titanicae]|jgi:hypothetical protein|uniref:Apea-like HEPN domain-containing protein n=1 Tax=Vreelandella titanicae BH1 TaxID=1204738 RepID=L9UC07_9GAMM|nr:hypothetical protein [Halomonas titanicae]ELY22161.1 hypothetical protein HALTITAN_0717 [Halomonas titanicae BH1]NVE89614.1 hypothetical protein [Halomonas titanicae]|tara:strand:+ start:2912 stop:3388 length:477 start_codon:yes stop_codon:yes gene_type:complete